MKVSKSKQKSAVDAYVITGRGALETLKAIGFDKPVIVINAKGKTAAKAGVIHIFSKRVPADAKQVSSINEARRKEQAIISRSKPKYNEQGT